MKPMIVAAAAAAALAATLAGASERQPVLSQIAVPHNYYYREMYLPQLTSGPSSLSWLADGSGLVFSMQGSLWRQRLDSTHAEQLTAGDGYDYQPDVSPDGRRVVFVRYDGRAVNLYELDLVTLATRPLTNGNDVNLEPRWSPDGTRLAFVSTRSNGRFRLYVGAVTDDGLESAPLLPERVSRTPRYYYSEYDHELSPAWSPDGSELLYVSNPEIIYGSGAVFRRALDGGEAVPVRLEETTWRARPDWSPDGKRVVYASYLGRQWHQLWLTTAAGGGDPVPLTYGDFDISGPRWSPDGSRIAYIANEHGGLEIRVQTFVGGKIDVLRTETRDTLFDAGTLVVRTLDTAGKPVPARIMVTAADGKRYAPDDAWFHADDGFNPRSMRFEPQYFHSEGVARITLPAGQAAVTVWRGPEYGIEQANATVRTGAEHELPVTLRPLPAPAGWSQFVSGDVHVHMNYGGHYRNTPARLARQAAAEDLDVVFNLVVNKEQRIPDVRAFTTAPDPATTPATLLLHAQEFHTSYWGHLGLLGLEDHLLVPDYSTYANTGLASPYPDNATVAELAHAQGALVGYVHPFLEVPDPASDPITNGLPVDAALGHADFYEVVGFADHRASAEVWYRLLDCGFNLAAAGGTDAMANYASLRGPVGINRTYAQVTGNPATPVERKAAWLDALRAGRTLATNGPLLTFEVDGVLPGGTLATSDGGRDVAYRGTLRSNVPVDHLELVYNGEVVQRFEPGADATQADISGTVRIAGNGWLLLRAWNESASPEVFDIYPYATTSAIAVRDPATPLQCGASADYFIAWLDRVHESAAAHPDYNTAAERGIVLDNIRRAREAFAARR